MKFQEAVKALEENRKYVKNIEDILVATTFGSLCDTFCLHRTSDFCVSLWEGIAKFSNFVVTPSTFDEEWQLIHLTNFLEKEEWDEKTVDRFLSDIGYHNPTFGFLDALEYITKNPNLCMYSVNAVLTFDNGVLMNDAHQFCTVPYKITMDSFKHTWEIKDAKNSLGD